MTFAAALRYKPGSAIAAVDSKVTWETGYVEYSRKGRSFGPGVFFEVGDASETLKMRNEILNSEPKKEKGKKNGPGYLEYLDIIKDVYKQIFQQRIEDEVLIPFNLDWKKFEQGRFPSQITSELTNRIKEVNATYDAQILYCAHDENSEDIHIASIESEGTQQYENFYTTGATDTPDQIFSSLTNENNIEINITDAQAMTTMLKALRDVDKNIFVGGRALIFYVDSTGVKELKKETVSTCGEIFSKGKDDNQISKEIEEILKADKK